jgi:cytochrome bd-type quinol oxidase subunit 2
MKRIPLPNRAIALPLLGLIITWALFMLGQWISMASAESYKNGPNPSIYVFLAALAVAAISSLIAQGWAVHAHNQSDGEGINRAAHRFTTLAVVLSLAALVIFVFGNFMGSFNSSTENRTLLDSLVWLYLPIILATALVVVVVLRAFVFQRDSNHIKGDVKAKMSEQQKALALGYAIPILTTAFAIILGLAIYQATRTNLQIWVWVIIISIVGYGVVMGTRYAAKAKSARQAPPKPKTALAAGAANLNFVLSIVFGGVVTIMAFSSGLNAVSKLQVWPTYVEGQTQELYPTLENPALQWYLEEMAPALVLLLLAAVGVYLSISERHRKAEKKA